MTTPTRPRVWLVAVATVVAIVVGATSSRAVTKAARCERALLNAAAKYWACVFRTRAVAATSGVAADLRLCEDRYGTKVLAIHQQYGNECPKSVWSGRSPRFVDPGDGTLIDRATGLQWEKKVGLDGKADPNEPHDADNLYTWTTKANAKEPNGTAFTSFLAALNGGTCFAGHCDWRLPALAELRTILLAPRPCDANPCIDPAFGPTASSTYWSGETSAYHPARAWYMMFISGYWTTAPKATPHHLRAVRGGRAVQ